MWRTARLCLSFLTVCIVFFASATTVSAKVHVIAFGKWMSVQWYAGPATGDKPLTLKIRALVVDGQVKEYMVGTPHDVTERLFVIRRAFRVNDSLPEDTGSHWQWQRGGWLLVDRVTGHVTAISLPEFDAFYSVASWYRDYVAYCGVGDDGKKTYAIVAQLTRKKPVLKKAVLDGVPAEDAAPDSACPAPGWQRSPTRVTFEPSAGAKQTFAIRGHIVDVVSDDDED
jgi:hypothetical protein